MRANQLFCLFLTFLVLFFCSCKKQTETIDDTAYQTERLSEILPLEAGKYIIYRADSTVFTNFNRDIEVHSYLEKNIVDAQITDAMGRTSYRIFRFITDTTGMQSWKPAGTFYITPLADQVEAVEDNFRYIKLHLPVKSDYTWKGNKYLYNNLYEPTFKFLNDDDFEEWDYTYESTNDVFAYNQQNLQNIVSVLQVNESSKLDTLNVAGNKAAVPQNSTAVWLQGNASDTIRITAVKPTNGSTNLTVYNQSNFYASLNNILIPPHLSLNFEYVDDKWFYPNPLTVFNNKVSIPDNISLAYLFGETTDTVKIDASQIDTAQVKRFTVYNKTKSVAYCNFSPALTPAGTPPIIPPGYGRTFDLDNRKWVTTGLSDKDPYGTDTPFGTKSYGIEKYAKGIGMVYKELILWEYQPNSGAAGGGYKLGFGIKRRMINHN